jgi:chorismate mutase
MNVSKRIGEWKKAHGVFPLQPERYQQIVEQRTEWAAHNGLEHGFVVQLLNAIHEQSLRMQE